MRRNFRARQKAGTGFSLVEVMVSTVLLMVGAVGVAQLVPMSLTLNNGNRNNSTSLILAQRVLNTMISLPLDAPPFTDAQGNLYDVGNISTPNVVVGSAVTVINGAAIIDFTASTASGYNVLYTDPDDPSRTVYDIRWAVIATVNPSGTPISKRFILGARQQGGIGYSQPVTLDSMVGR